MADFMSNSLKQWFETALWNSRFVVLVTVVISVMSAVALVLLVTADFVGILTTTVHSFSPAITSEMHDSLLGDIARKIIAVIDISLLAAFMLIFAFGLYELFIGELAVARASSISRRLLEIESLEDLKTRLGKIILIILIVEVFKDANRPETPPLNLVYLTVGIALIALALYLTHAGEAPKTIDSEEHGRTDHRRPEVGPR